MNAFISNAGEFNDFYEAYLRYQFLEVTGSSFLRFRLCRVLVAACRLSPAAVCGLLVSVASLVAHGLKRALACSFSCSVACGFSWSRDQTHIPGIGRWMLNLWTTREILQVL